MIEHLVTSNPSPAYVQRIANVFRNDGQGVTGNLKAVIAAILTDSEARAADDPALPSAPSYGHMREPILFMANILRGLNASTSIAAVSNDASEMSENLFNSASVFSYFSPQSRTEFGLLGPEFQIYSTQTAADRVNIVDSILYGAAGKAFKINLTPFVDLAGNTSTLLSYISAVFLHGSMPSALEEAASTAVNAAATPAAKAQAALYVVLTSSQYQIIQ